MGAIFSIDKYTPLVLYGAATTAALLFRRFVSWNLNVSAFIDKRADEINTFLGCPVYRIDNSELDRENVVVLFAVKNVFEHSRIAKKLYDAGYKKLIYRPYNALNGKGNKEEQRLDEIYSLITEADSFISNNFTSIPVLDAMKTADFSEHGVISKVDGLVTFYLPVSMIFTDKDGNESNFQYSVLCLKPHINFVKFLLGNGGELQSYLDYCINAAKKTGVVKITQAWKENVIANRSEVFFDMLHKYNLEPDFFIRKAVDVVWNDERAYFNLNSGKHRAAFLCALGKNYIAVRSSVSDYKKYLMHIKVDAIWTKSLSKYEDGFSPPIENPFFYECARYSEHFWFALLRKIAACIAEWYYDSGSILKGLHFYNEISDADFLCSFLLRMGCSVSYNGEHYYDIAILNRYEENSVKSTHYIVLSDNEIFRYEYCLTFCIYRGRGKTLFIYAW